MMMMTMISAILMRKLIIYSKFEHMFVKMVLNLSNNPPIQNEFGKMLVEQFQEQSETIIKINSVEINNWKSMEKSLWQNFSFSSMKWGKSVKFTVGLRSTGDFWIT